MKQNKRISGIILLATACTALDSSAITRRDGFIFSATALVGAMYAHLALPWISNQHKLEEEQRLARLHAQDQESCRDLYRSLVTKYNATTMPMTSSDALSTYKNNVVLDINKLESILDFGWDDALEKESIAKLIAHLKDHELQVTHMIGIKIGHEIQALYKDELAMLAKDSTCDATKMTKILYEKYGETTYKFSTYKLDLHKSIARCKQYGAESEIIAILETLNKQTNYLFANALEAERTNKENVDKQQKLFNAELDGKFAIKDFYKEAQHHVAMATQTVERCDQQYHKIQHIADNCSSMLHAIMNMFTTWGVRSEQQTERVVYEVRQEGRTTRDALRVGLDKNIAVERKLNEVDKKAQKAQQTAKQAEKKAEDAKYLADVALTPPPPATNPELNNDNAPSAPPFDE